MDDFAPDPFMETVAAATGKVYPSPGAMRWATQLADEYGEELVMRAIGYVVTNGAEPHEVLKRAQEALEYRAAKAELNEERRRLKEQEQARRDRDDAQRKRFQKLAEDFEPVTPERVADIMSQVPLIADRQKEQDD